MGGPETGGYVVVKTTKSDEKSGRPTTQGAINGGFFTKSAEHAHPSVVIAVDDINEHVQKVTAGGGKVLGEPVEIPHVGLYVSFVDTEGNTVSLLQPSPDM